MSLLDSLLLEPHPLDVWIALRTEGVKGNGTESDPYDGSLAHAAPISVTLTSSGQEATATATNHGYSDGDFITIAGVTGGGAAQFNGRFRIYSITSNTFKYWMTGIPGASAAGTITAAKVTAFRFDDVMALMPANTAIHLGPGVFETKGHSQLLGGREAQPGWRIIGSGMEVTTLKLIGPSVVGASAVNGHFVAFGTLIGNSAPYFEASDFTVDCNLGGQSIKDYDFAPVACAAILVGGSHTRIRRVRAINFGSQTVTKPVECFVLTTAWSHPSAAEVVDCVIEDCIVERPSVNNTHLTTCLGFGGFIERGAFHRGCVIRNCVVNCEYPGGAPSHLVSVSSVTKSATGPPWTITVVTATPHFRAIGNNIVLNSAVSTYNGPFKVTEVVNSTTLKYQVQTDPGTPPNAAAQPVSIGVAFHCMSVSGGTGAVLEGNHVLHARFANYGDTYSTRDMVIRNNFFHDVYCGCFFVMQGSGPLNVGSALARDGSTAIFTALQAHGLSVGNNVTIKNAVVNNSTNNVYNGTFTVQSVISSTKFSYQMTGVPSDLPNATSAPLWRLQSQSDTQRKPGATLKRDTGDPTIAVFTALEAHGLSAGSSINISGAVVNDSTTNPFNGNFSVLDVPDALSFRYQMSAVPATDAFSAPVFDAGSGEKVGTPLVHGTGADDDLATFTSLLPHGLLPGEAIQVSGAWVSGLGNPFNGYYEIESVPSSPSVDGKPTSLTYRMSSAPSANASRVPQYAEVWQTRHTVIENNVIELTPGLPSLHGPAVGIYLVEFLHVTTLPRFQGLVIRGNVIRELNDSTDSNTWGMYLYRCRNGIVENNVIDPKVGNFIKQDQSSSMEYFNNRTPAGAFLQALDGPSNRKIEELTTRIEDAAVLAF